MIDMINYIAMDIINVLGTFGFLYTVAAAPYLILFASINTYYFAHESLRLRKIKRKLYLVRLILPRRQFIAQWFKEHNKILETFPCKIPKNGNIVIEHFLIDESKNPVNDYIDYYFVDSRLATLFKLTFG